MKTISLISRLDSLSLSEFRDYYECVHCLKAMKYFPFKMYRRNYIVAGGEDLDFDCVSEVKVDRRFDLSGIRDSDAWASMKEDERQFMKPEKIRFCRADERPLIGNEKLLPTVGKRRFLVLFNRGAMQEADFCDYLREIGKGLTKRPHSSNVRSGNECSFDIVQSEGAGVFPFDGMLWMSANLSLKELVQHSEGLPGLKSVLQVESFESDSDVMRYRFEGKR